MPSYTVKECTSQEKSDFEIGSRPFTLSLVEGCGRSWFDRALLSAPFSFEYLRMNGAVEGLTTNGLN
jgi:hypothetical protein